MKTKISAISFATYMLFGAVIIAFFTACPMFDPNFPYNDDPTTVGDFKSSKFDGFWEVQDPEAGRQNFKPLLYLFRGNIFQSFGYNRTNPNYTSTIEINEGNEPKEFLYSDKVIYNKEFYNTYEWRKTPYKLSADGNDLTLGEYQLKKIEIESAKKDDILGSWYIINYNNEYRIHTFNESSLVIQSLKNGQSICADTHVEISLSDEYYMQQENSARVYYYFYDNRLLLSYGGVFRRYNDNRFIYVNSLSDAEKKFADHKFGGETPLKHVEVHVRMDIGDLSRSDNDYFRLLEIIGNYNIYVELLLGGAGMGGTTVFTSPPLNEAIKGMEKVIKILLPRTATSVIAASNEISPFYFYENLIEVSFVGIGLPEIGDFAFRSCKSLIDINMRSAVITIGKEAFAGCENLKTLTLGASLESIGDRAFFDCETLSMIRMPGKPPTLGEDVFLGNTPSDLTFYVEYKSPFWSWLYENASKFNNVYNVNLEFID